MRDKDILPAGVHVEHDDRGLPVHIVDPDPCGTEDGDSGRTPIEPARAVDLAELLAHEFPVREYILDPVLTLGSLNMLYAWRGIGKTHVALGIAYAAASGEQFLNWKAARPFKVLYIDGEMPGESLQARLASIVAASEKRPAEGYFRVLTIDLMGGLMPDLATREGQAAIAEECELAELIIVDNLSCLLRGSGRENEAESWLLAAEWALSMRSKGKSVLFVHRAGKDGNQRGTSKRNDLLGLLEHD
jgi:RecA-family ATPase